MSMSPKQIALVAALGAIAISGITLGALMWRDRQTVTLDKFIVPKNLPKPTPGNPPVLFAAPAVQSTKFVNQEGKPAGDEQLHGRVWIADFIFTHCAGMCPEVTAKMVQLQKDLADDPDIRFVSFSVDPERDDPHTLKAYGEQHHPGDNRWLLLRPADRKAVLQIAQRMTAVSRSTDAHDQILHTDSFILMDHTGKVRGLYDSKKAEDIDRLKADARGLAKQRVADNPKAGVPSPRL